MKINFLSVFTNGKPQGAGAKFRVMIIGQPEAHIMDWRGCNFRRLALPKEYRKVFDKVSEAQAYLKALEALDKQDERFNKYARSLGDGASFDQRFMV